MIDISAVRRHMGKEGERDDQALVQAQGRLLAPLDNLCSFTTFWCNPTVYVTI